MTDLSELTTIVDIPELTVEVQGVDLKLPYVELRYTPEQLGYIDDALAAYQESEYGSYICCYVTDYLERYYDCSLAFNELSLALSAAYGCLSVGSVAAFYNVPDTSNVALLGARRSWAKHIAAHIREQLLP